MYIYQKLAESWVYGSFIPGGYTALDIKDRKTTNKGEEKLSDYQAVIPSS
jgi:hypothetical protein